MQINIRVIPNAKQNKIVESDDNALRVYVTTVPEDNKANVAVIKLLAEYFNVSKSRIKVIKGITVRDKTILIQD